MIATRRFAVTAKSHVFALIWFGQVVSLVGSGLTSFAVGVWVFQDTGSVTSFALISFFATLPGVLLSPIAGALVDRWDRRWAMILSDTGAAFSSLALFFLVRGGEIQMWQIYLLAASSSACSAFQWPAYSAITTMLMPKEQLGRANGMIQIGPAAAQVIAPLLAGILVFVIDVQGVILIDLVTFLFALATLMIVQVPRPESSASGQEAQGTLWQESLYGWRYIKTRPGLLGLLFFLSVYNLILGLVLVLILPLVLSFADAFELGIVLSTAGSGMLLGGFVMSAWGGPKRLTNGLFGFSMFSGTILLLGGLQPSVPLVAIASFAFLFGYQIMISCSQAIWQRKVAPDVQGRVFSMRMMNAMFFSAFARLIAGPLADDVFEPLLAVDGPLADSLGRIIGTGAGRGIGLLFIVLGGLAILATIGAYLFPRTRRLEQELPDAIADSEPSAGAATEKVKGTRRWPLYAGIAVALLVIIPVGLGMWFVRRPWPQVSGTISVAGLTAPVEVIRDKWGIPHIYAQNEHDLFFAQGYVHAQDRLWQMEWNRHFANGTISAETGESGLPFDRWLRTLGLRRMAERSWADVDDETRAILQAYAGGVNAYIDTHRDRLPLEFTIMGIKPDPWTPVDTLAWGNAMSLQLSGNYRFELVRMQMIAEVGEQVTQHLFPPFARDMPLIIPDGVGQYEGFRNVRFDGLEALDEWLGNPTHSWGSNNWVVHGSRTDSGLPILANDTHLGLGMPAIWYENGLHGGRFDSVGFTFPGVPLVVIGHNHHIAWGTTNLGPDVQDLYLEKLNDPENPTQYEFMGQWHDLEIVHETIEVKGGEPETLEIRLTRHGPLMNDVLSALENEGEPMALRWTLYETSPLVKAVIRLNLATNWDEFRAALREWELPSQNFVYADTAGNIGYQAPGKVPIRPPGYQGTLPVPGWTGEYEWQGFIPFEALPYDFNPPAGFIATANNKVTSDDYPYHLTYDWFPGYRAQRITELLAANDHHTVASMQQLHAETFSLPATALRPYMLAIEPENDLQAEALAHLKDWDLYLETDRVGASIYETWYWFMLRNTVGDELGEEQEEAYLTGNYQRHGTQHMPMMIELMADPESPWFDDVNTLQTETRDDILRRSLVDALDWLNERYGRDPQKWEWGRMHTMTFAHSPLSGNSALARFFNSKTMPVPGDPFTVNAASFNWNDPFQVVHGTSQRMILDLSDWDNSLGVFTTGQSGQAFHPQRESMVSLWRKVMYHPLPFTREAVEANADAVLTLEPK